MSHQIHATRDHKFRPITVGELSWARATTPASRPEVKSTPTKFVPVDTDAIRPLPTVTSASNFADPGLCMVGRFAKVADRSEPDLVRTFAICDELNRRLMPHLCD